MMAIFIFVLLYLSSISSILSSGISNLSHSIEVADLSHQIEAACAKALGDDHSKDLNNFGYGCFLKKYNSSQINVIVEDFKLCCNLMLSKNREDKELDCPNRFCECIDMINLVHRPFIKECRSEKLPQCEITTSPWGHDDELREDVGTILVLKKNVILGGWGIAIFTILSLISLGGFGYLVFICVLYRCCRKKNDEIQVEENYYVDNPATASIDGGGYEYSDASIAATTTPHSAITQTTQSITQIPHQQQQQEQPKQQPSGSTGDTKTKEMTTTISIDKS
uniref:Uncharacterized protein n=1 Tax=Panagrolaimus sp. ES5 TaxID=591445 RepID=A0AC34FCX3_9BILA